MAEVKSENVERIVVRGTNWVGDAVMTVPALRQLRQLFPKAHITLATRSWARGLFADATFIDELLLIDYKGPFSFWKEVQDWRNGRFDLALLFPNSFAVALVAALARVPMRIGYATDGRVFLLTEPVQLPEWRSERHEVYYYSHLIKAVAERLKLPEVNDAPNPLLEVSPARKMQAVELLRAKGINEHQLVIALCPGSINSRAKRWPAERYALLADELIEELDAVVLLIGSPEELDVSLEVGRRMRKTPVMLTGQTQLDELVAILNEVDLLITNDTGPAHISAALDRPTLVIFGPTNPLTTRPFSSKAEVLRKPPDCAPCMLRDCPIDHRCMTAITPEEVLSKARVLISNKLQLVMGK